VDEPSGDLQAVLKQFAASGKDNDKIIYAQKRSAIATLLHEVGHQFGMDHAHDPSPSSVTGGLEVGKDLQGNAVQSYRTDLSKMAYGIPYMYLTEDDLRGIRSLAKVTGEFLAARHP
jgi:hypothetical protein